MAKDIPVLTIEFLNNCQISVHGKLHMYRAGDQLNVVLNDETLLGVLDRIVDKAAAFDIVKAKLRGDL